MLIGVAEGGWLDENTSGTDDYISNTRLTGLGCHN